MRQASEGESLLKDAAPAPSAVAAQLAGPAEGRPVLGTILKGVDAGALTVAWATVLAWRLASFGTVDTRLIGQALWVAFAVVTATLGLMVHQRLYVARACAVKATETVRLGRAALAAGVLGLALSVAAGFGISLAEASTGSALSFVLLLNGRTWYRSWLAGCRRRGRFVRPTVIVGTNDEALGLCQLLKEHPELGLRVRGVVGPQADIPVGFDAPWLGTTADAVGACRRAGANGALIATSAVPVDELNRMVRELLDASVHTQLSAGLRGIDHRRIRACPLAYEPIFYLERASLSRPQVFAKRVLDLAVATCALLVSWPLIAAAAIAIKLQDGGPVLFRQQRVGLDGRLFTIYKLRSMVPDAEHHLVEVLERNQRTDGPLFKLADDPRVTPVGRFLRATSLDELPQLFNVVRGEMSLVGPRPALPLEDAQFDDALRARTGVRPGITGLWQVEARDNPGFSAYQRLDLYYVENWSLGLDLTILLATAHAVVTRAWGALRPLRWGAGTTKEAQPCVLD